MSCFLNDNNNFLPGFPVSNIHFSSFSLLSMLTLTWCKLKAATLCASSVTGFAWTEFSHAATHVAHLVFRRVGHNAKRALKWSSAQDSPLSLGESFKMYSKLYSNLEESFKTLPQFRGEF